MTSWHYDAMTQRSRPHVVAFLGQKGGSGKTTLAVHVAVAAQADGERVAILDTDPQASATAWGEFRQGKPPLVATISPTQVDEVLAIAQQENISLIIIDTAPHAAPGAAQAIKEADLVILPCRPTGFDLKVLPAAISIATAARKHTAIILNACPQRAPEIPEAQAFLKGSYDIPLIPTTIGDRRSYFRAVTTGQAVTEFEPDGQAADEIRTLWHWIKEQLPHE